MPPAPARTPRALRYAVPAASAQCAQSLARRSSLGCRSCRPRVAQSVVRPVLNMNMAADWVAVAPPPAKRARVEVAEGGGTPAFDAPSALGSCAPAFGAPSALGVGAPAFGAPSAPGGGGDALGAAPAAGGTFGGAAAAGGGFGVVGCADALPPSRSRLLTPALPPSGRRRQLAVASAPSVAPPHQPSAALPRPRLAKPPLRQQPCTPSPPTTPPGRLKLLMRMLPRLKLKNTAMVKGPSTARMKGPYKSVLAVGISLSICGWNGWNASVGLLKWPTAAMQPVLLHSNAVLSTSHLLLHQRLAMTGLA